MLLHDTVTLVHAVGFATGVALYAMLALMVLRAAPGAGAPDRIPLATAALGLAWNVGALIAYGIPGLGLPGDLAPAVRWVGAAAFSALGFLPAVVVHAALQGSQGRVRALLTAAAYALSAVAAGLHAWGAASGPVPSGTGLRVLSLGYVTVLGALAVRLRRPGEQHRVGGEREVADRLAA